MSTSRHPRALTCLAASLVCALGLAGAAGADPAETGEERTAQQRTRADALAEEESRKAAAARDVRTPTVVQEAARVAVPVAEQPTLRYEDYQRQVETRMSEKRGEMLRYLDQILEQADQSEEKPALLFQKAELYLEEKQFQFFQGMALDDPIADAVVGGTEAEIDALQVKKKAYLEESLRWLREAVILLQEIADEYPDFERIPDVYFALGRAFWDAGSYKKSLESYRKLIRNHPDNQYSADAWLAFGEFYFQVGPDDERDVTKALDAYTKAAKFQDSPVFGYAIYKQGWCLYNKGMYDRSTDKFREVILYSDINADLLGEKRLALAREARKDYVLSYAQYGDAKNAVSEFSKVASGDDIYQMLLRLADIYYGNGKDRDAIILYQDLMSRKKDDPSNPLLQGKIVKIASRIGNKRQVVGQVRRLIEEFERVRQRYGEGGASADEEVQDKLREAEVLADNTIRYLATTWHNEAKKTREDSTYEYAFELYSDYLELFPKRPEAYELRFFYAELLYRLERYALAGEQYLAVFRADPQGKWAEAAAEEAVRAYDELAKDERRREEKTASPASEALLRPRDVPEAQTKLLAACENYVAAYPAGKIVVEAQYRIARTWYDYSHFDESTERFFAIAEKHSSHPRAEQSANLVLDTYNILGAWQQLHDAARLFSQSRDLMRNAEFAAQLVRVLEESSFKLIGEFEKKGEWSEAAARYLAFAEEFTQSPLADKALANSAAMYTKDGDLTRAIKIRKKLVSQFPKSALLADQILAIASAYEQTVSYRQAATWLERFVEKFPKDPRAQDALYNAGIYWQGVGQSAKSVAARERFVKQYPGSSDAEDVAFSVAVVWDQAKDERRAVDAYLSFAGTWAKKAPARAVTAYYQALRVMERNPRFRREYARHYPLFARQAQGLAEAEAAQAPDALAYVAFLDADRVFAEFRGVKIARADKPDEFRRSLRDKISGKDKVYSAYTEVVKRKSADWAVASLYRIGELHELLARQISDVPPPRQFTPEQAQLFRDKLMEQTLPIEDQAAQAMILCLEKSAELGVFHEWTAQCLAYLEEHRPAQFPRNELEEIPPWVIELSPPLDAHGVVGRVPAPGERPHALRGGRTRAPERPEPIAGGAS